MSYAYQNVIIGNRLDVNPSGHVITTAKGQLISDDGTKTVVQPAAVSNNQALVSDSTQSTGLIWKNLTIADLGITAGDGLVLTGNQIDVGGSSTIFANPDNLVVNSSAVANQVLLSSGTVGTSAVYGALPLNQVAAVTGILPFANNGTGSATFSNANSIVATNVGGTALVTTGINPADISTQTATITTSDATTTTILSIPTIADTAYNIKATFLARQTTTPFPTTSFKVEATFNNVAGTLTLVGGANDLVYVPNTTTWLATIVATGTNILLQVNGDTNTINWKVRVQPILSL